VKTKIIRIPDIILIALFLIFAGAFYFIIDLTPDGGSSDTAVIRVNGEIYAEVGLTQIKNVEIYFADGTLSNIVRIKNGRAYMIYAACPDKRCLRQDYFIVCLPNRVTVELTNRRKSEFDIVI
jgi:hypothetical protein